MTLQTSDEGWDENPPRKWVDHVPVGVLVLVITAALFQIIFGGRRPDILPSIVGCYVGSGSMMGETLVLDGSSILIAGETRTPFEITDGKQGLSISLKRSISSPTAFKGERVSPMYWKISEDRHSFIFNNGDRKATFSRIACP